MYFHMMPHMHIHADVHVRHVSRALNIPLIYSHTLKCTGNYGGTDSTEGVKYLTVSALLYVQRMT